jgi:hypothetical protein
MAYVPISIALRQEVNHVINNLAGVERQSLGGAPEVVVSEDDITRELWGEHYRLRDKVPAAWRNLVRQIVVRVETAAGDIIYNQYHILNALADAPPRCGINHIAIRSDDPRAVKYTAWYKEIKELEDRWRKVRDTVDSFLRQCKSLNEAVKVMPELEHYLTPRLKAKLEEKTVRVKSKTTVTAPDQEARENLIHSFVSARISGGGGV